MRPVVKQFGQDNRLPFRRLFGRIDSTAREQGNLPQRSAEVFIVGASIEDFHAVGVPLECQPLDLETILLGNIRKLAGRHEANPSATIGTKLAEQEVKVKKLKGQTINKVRPCQADHPALETRD